MSVRTFEVRIAKPAEYATLTLELDDEDATMDDVWSEAWDFADAKDSQGEIEWEMPEWVIDIVDIEEVS